MAITNPATMGASAGLFAAFGPVDMHISIACGAFWLVAGVFSGSALWWLMLVGGVGFIRDGFLRARIDAPQPHLRYGHRRVGRRGAGRP